MVPRYLNRWYAVVCALVMGVATGCDSSDTSTLELATFPKDGEVFLDGFSSGLNFAAFGGSKVDAINIDATVKYRGARSLKFIVPGANDPSGFYAGGAFYTTVGRDLTEFNALTFWARASVVATMGTVGFGNDNTGTSRFVTEVPNVPVTTVWQRFVVPMPLAANLTQETGLFHFAAGAVEGHGYEIWFDEVQFENMGTLGPPQPSFISQDPVVAPGETVQIEGLSVGYDLLGITQTVNPSPYYFTFASSNASVATVNDLGLVRAVDLGDAVITATLGSTPVEGAITLTVAESSPGPSEAAPTPTYAAGDVISLFSNAYTDVPVATWSADWDVADVMDTQVAGDDVKLYTNLLYAGIEFPSPTIDATSMTHFRMDIWTPDPTGAPAAFRIKLVDFGADDAYGGGDDAEHELMFTAASSPALQTEAWVIFDIPLSRFTGLVTRGNLAQLIISGEPNTVYVDNVLLRR